MPVQVSEFAKKNSIKDQRKLLPVYECREDLLQVIRENQVVVVVGETGSGKTTQASRHQRCPSNFLFLHWIVSCEIHSRIVNLTTHYP